MPFDSIALNLVIGFASFFLQIIAIMQQLMEESAESIILVIASLLAALNF
jgi:hypothetical protein